MSNKTQDSNYFSLLRKSGSYKNMLNFMAIVYETYMATIYTQYGKINYTEPVKFHFHKLKLTCSIDRLYKGTIDFHFHTNAKI